MALIPNEPGRRASGGRRILTAAVAGLLLTGRAPAAPVYVNSQAAGGGNGAAWDTAFASVTQALAAATSGDELWVAGGTYDEGATIAMKAGVDLYGGFTNGMATRDARNGDAHPTVLTGAGVRRVLQGADNARLDGFVVRNGYHATVGGGMYNAGAAPAIANCLFTDNAAGQYAGALDHAGVDGGATLIVSNCVFRRNVAPWGGGLRVVSGPVTILGSDFADNNGTANNWGGALVFQGWQDGSPLLVEDCRFTGNRGGGAVFFNQYGGDYTVSTVFRRCVMAGNVTVIGGNDASVYEDCVFSGNVSGTYGAIYYGTAKRLRFKRCVFAGNQAGGHGGLLSYYGATEGAFPVLENCLAAGNHSGGSGGAIHIWPGYASRADLRHCTFAGNRAVGNGGALHAASLLTPITNCVFWGNAAASGSQIHEATADRVSLSYSCIQGGWGGLGGHNTTNNPLFTGGATGTWTTVGPYDSNIVQTVLTRSGAGWTPDACRGLTVNPDTGQNLQFAIASNGTDTLYVWGNALTNRAGAAVAQAGDTFQIHDYLPRYGSPLVDAGADIGVGDDLLGTERPQGDGVDIGACEMAIFPNPKIEVAVGPAGVTETAAWLQGVLTRAGLEPDGGPASPHIWSYWGLADGGTNPAAWSHTNYFGTNTPAIPAAYSNFVSGLAPHTIHYYTFRASNAFGDAWPAASARFRTLGPPAVENDAGATGLGLETATLRGALTDGGVADVTVFWGPSDGGMNRTAWSNSVHLPLRPEGAFAVAVADVLPGPYYYRCYASNAVNEAWAPASAAFMTHPAFAEFAHRARIPLRYDGAETLTNFPALVVFDEGKRFFRYADFEDAGGADLRFSDATGTRALAYEVDMWNPAGKSFVWARVPELKPGAAIWAYWGHADAAFVPAYATNGGVWDADYLAVWHMGEANARDATAHANHGTAQGGSLTGAVGQIGMANDFTRNTDYVAVPDRAEFSLSGPYTVSAWIRSDAVGNVWEDFAGTHTGGNSGFLFSLRDNAAHELSFCAGGQWRYSGAGIPDGQWANVAYTREGTTGRFFVNGSNVTTIADAVAGSDGGELHLGAAGTGRSSYRFDGRLDEVRLSRAARSPDWMRACWANQSAPETFAPLGQGWPLPAIDSPVGPTNVTHSAATVFAELYATGAAPTEVWLHWGHADGGTDASVWESHDSQGFRDAGSVVARVTGLLDRTNYFYRFQATNDHGEAWASQSHAFRTRFNAEAMRGSNYLGTNMSFETGFGPDQGWYGLSGDQVAFVGGDACDGVQMFTFTASDGNDCDAYQWVDLSYYRDLIVETNVTFEASIGVNYLNTSANNFRFWVEFYDAADQLLLQSPPFAWPHTIDADADTWERIAVPSGRVPAAARRASLHLRVESGAPWSGYFMDCAEFILVVPGEPPPPTGGMLIVR